MEGGQSGRKARQTHRRVFWSGEAPPPSSSQGSPATPTSPLAYFRGIVGDLAPRYDDVGRHFRGSCGKNVGRTWDERHCRASAGLRPGSNRSAASCTCPRSRCPYTPVVVEVLLCPAIAETTGRLHLPGPPPPPERGPDLTCSPAGRRPVVLSESPPRSGAAGSPVVGAADRAGRPTPSTPRRGRSQRSAWPMTPPYICLRSSAFLISNSGSVRSHWSRSLTESPGVTR